MGQQNKAQKDYHICTQVRLYIFIFTSLHNLSVQQIPSMIIDISRCTWPRIDLHITKKNMYHLLSATSRRFCTRITFPRGCFSFFMTALSPFHWHFFSSTSARLAANTAVRCCLAFNFSSFLFFCFLSILGIFRIIFARRVSSWRRSFSISLNFHGFPPFFSLFPFLKFAATSWHILTGHLFRSLTMKKYLSITITTNGLLYQWHLYTVFRMSELLNVVFVTVFMSWSFFCCRPLSLNHAFNSLLYPLISFLRSAMELRFISDIFMQNACWFSRRFITFTTALHVR